MHDHFLRRRDAEFQSAPRLSARGNNRTGPTFSIPMTFQSAPRLSARGNHESSTPTPSGFPFQSAPRLSARGNATDGTYERTVVRFNPPLAFRRGETVKCLHAWNAWRKFQSAPRLSARGNE